MTQTEKEVKNVLLGRTMLLEDGRLSTLGPDDYIMPVGVSDGAMGVRILGIAKKDRVLVTELSEAKVTDLIRKAMQNIGRGLVLVEAPESTACLIRYVLTRPAVAAFCYREGVPVLSVYAGRGLTGWISLIRALKAVEKQLPDTVALTQGEVPEEVDLTKEKKARKKLERAQRKAEKAARRMNGGAAVQEEEPAESENAGETEQ